MLWLLCLISCEEILKFKGNRLAKGLFVLGAVNLLLNTKSKFVITFVPLNFNLPSPSPKNQSISLIASTDCPRIKIKTIKF